MDQYEIGSLHVIWVNPFYEDVEAEVVAYTKRGEPIVRTVHDDVTLEPHEYVFPTEEEVQAISAVRRNFKERFGEEI